jgi:hypothetical protein
MGSPGPAIFLFSTSPSLEVYYPTGRNSNLLYANAGASTLPNGIGFGGQLDHFGLWIQSDLCAGHSRTAGEVSLTFGNPTLSSTPEFQIDKLEIWVLDRKDYVRDESEEIPMENKKGILETHPELVGKRLLTLLQFVIYKPVPLCHVRCFSC